MCGIVEKYNFYTREPVSAELLKTMCDTEEGLLPHGEPSKEDAEKAIVVSKLVVERLRKL